MAEADSPSKVSNDELVENCLILIQQLFAENLINGTERDHLKGKRINQDILNQEVKELSWRRFGVLGYSSWFTD
jgi:hypothetical protein